MSFEKLLAKNADTDHCSNLNDTRIPTSENSLSMQEFSRNYPPQYFSHDGQRSHFVDTGEGKYDRTVLCLHSRFGWAYSFRKILPKLVYHGYRVVAVDLLGFGLSDKPEDITQLSITAQARRLKALIEHLGLTELTLVGHEMGASIAAQLPSLLPGSVDALVFANPAARILEAEWPGLHMWRTLMNAKNHIDVGAEIARICPNLTEDEIAAYNTPLKTPNSLHGLRHFHKTVVLDKNDPDYVVVEDGYRWLRDDWSGRSLVLVGAEDTIFGIDAAKQFCHQIGCTDRIIQLEGVCGHPFEQHPDSIDTVVNMLFSA